MPMTTPARRAHGAVSYLPSIQYPMSANPAVAPASCRPAPEYLTQPGNRRFSVTVPMLCEMIHGRVLGSLCWRFQPAVSGFLSFHSETSPSVSGHEIYRTDSLDANRLSGRIVDVKRKLFARAYDFPEDVLL